MSLDLTRPGLKQLSALSRVIVMVPAAFGDEQDNNHLVCALGLLMMGMEHLSSKTSF